MKKILKFIKYYWATICLVTVFIFVTVGVSVAVYTNFNSVKRVVSLGKVADTLFSANYLSLVNISDINYSTRRISPSEIKGGDNSVVTGYTFTVRICNHNMGNETVWNNKEIQYTFKVQLVARNGGDLPEGITNIKIKQASVDNTPESAIGSDGTFLLAAQVLSSDKANKLDYVFTVPTDLKEAVNFQIVAEPDAGCLAAVNDQKLAAIINLTSLTLTENWTGEFIDDNSIPANQYDFLNYEISGYGKGKVTLTWQDKLQISPWFLQDRGISPVDNSDGTYSCTFEVGETNEGDTTNVYQLQFYKNGTLDLNWEQLKNMVTVNFQKNQGE